MKIVFKNEVQTQIADMIWNAQNPYEIDMILRLYGHDAQVVYNMILAETFDQFFETDIAEAVLDKIFKG